jgi:hypothetical protein
MTVSWKSIHPEGEGIKFYNCLSLRGYREIRGFNCRF